MTDSGRTELLSGDVYTHLSRLGLLGGDVGANAFGGMTWDLKETVFVSLLDRLGRPTLGQYARERRSFQQRPAEARLDRKRWSEDTFRSIFLKIVLKDLRDLGFARVLSVDDLITKRRSSLLAMHHLVTCIDPTVAPLEAPPKPASPVVREEVLSKTWASPTKEKAQPAEPTARRRARTPSVDTGQNAAPSGGRNADEGSRVRARTHAGARPGFGAVGSRPRAPAVPPSRRR